MVAERNRHEAGAVRVRPRRRGQFQDAVLGERPDGQVVVARPAKAAQVRATAHDLDEETGAKLRVGREDRRHRRIHGLRRLERGLAHDWRGAGAGFGLEAIDHAGLAVVHVVERGHVVAARLNETLQQILAIRGLLECHEQRRNQRLTFASGNDVGKQGERLGVDERHRAANHHQRVVVCPSLGARGNACEPQHRQHVGVVPLERHREGQDVEVAHQGLRLERDERGARSLQRGNLTLGGQEHALAHDVRLGIEQAVHRLEAEVRHSHEVGIGEREGHAQAPAVGLADIAHLFGQKGFGLLALLPLVHEQYECTPRPDGDAERLGGSAGAPPIAGEESGDRSRLKTA